jgi:hypothetical protein
MEIIDLDPGRTPRAPRMPHRDIADEGLDVEVVIIGREAVLNLGRLHASGWMDRSATCLHHFTLVDWQEVKNRLREGSSKNLELLIML